MAYLVTDADITEAALNYRDVKTKTALYTMLYTDDVVICTSGSFAITLPTAVGRTGRPLTVKNAGTGTITMDTTSAQTIDGAAAALTQVFPGDCLDFLSDGANWVVV